MKTLYILRHAKASNSYSTFADIDRPLKETGVQEAYLLGHTLKQANFRVGQVMVSSAARALQTATIVARTALIPFAHISIDHRLYLPEAGVTLTIIRQTNDNINELMIVGHNPDLSELCNELLDNFSTELPTCGLVSISFNASSWSSIGKENSHKEFTIFPQ